LPDKYGMAKKKSSQVKNRNDDAPIYQLKYRINFRS